MQGLLRPPRVSLLPLGASARNPSSAGPLGRRRFVGGTLLSSSSLSSSSPSPMLSSSFAASVITPRAAIKDVVAAAADASGLTAKEAEAAVRAAFDFIAEEVAKGEKVTVAGFGTFERRERPARAGRNPRTGESISIAAKSSPAFVAAKAFKEQVAK